eukprot:8753313-Prorocentrum_lima.AAC.1
MGKLLFHGPDVDDPPIMVWDFTEERFYPSHITFTKDDNGDFIELPPQAPTEETLDEAEYGIEPDVYEDGHDREDDP